MLMEWDRFKTRNLKFKSLLEDAKNVAQTLNPVVIQGEPGTGKRELAIFIMENSGRSQCPLSRISPEQFRVDKINNLGTVIVENIDQLSAEQQNSLLNVLATSLSKGLDNGPRWIATAGPEVHELIKSGFLNAKLYHALSTQKFYMPSLADRPEDHFDLISDYVEKLNEFSSEKIKIDSLTIKHISSRKFEKNIAGLFSFLDSFYIQSKNQPQADESKIYTFKTQAGISLSEMERKLILQTLDITNQNRTKAAEILGISIRTLRNKLNEYRLGGANESTL